MIESLKSDFENNSKAVRWHNIFDALMYYTYWKERRYIYDKTKKNNFLNSYIQASTIDDFWLIWNYLNELFSS